MGKDALYLQFFGASFAFLSYHLFRGVTWYISGHRNAYWHQYYDKTTSLLGDTQKLSIRRILIPVANAIVFTAGLVGVFGAFYFLGLCRNPVNSGVISSIFSTSLVFVALLFYCLFG